MVFRAASTRTWKLRVDHPDGRHAVLSTECTDKDDADEVEAVVRRWQGKRGKKHQRLDVIDALVEKRVKLAAAVEAYHEGTLDDLLDAHPVEAPSLAPHVEAWVADKKNQKKGAGQADTYRDQLGWLFPEINAGTFTLNVFTRKALWERLDRLDVQEPTKNRYRAAASSFAKYLVKREIIERNWVRDIEGYSENDPRLVYYEIRDAKRLIGSIDHTTVAGMSAAALGFCMEWGAIDAALVSDFDLKADPPMAHVRGTKLAWRDRYVPLVSELRWVLPYIKRALAGKLPNAKAFDDLPEWKAIDVQRATADTATPKIVAVGEDQYGQHSIHDWRHTHAVALLRWNYAEQIVADHEGHKDTAMVRSTYGRFKPTKHDYAKAKPDATTSVTVPSNRQGKR